MMDPNRACHAQRQKPSIFGTSYGPGRQVQTAPIPFKFQPNQVHTHRLVPGRRPGFKWPHPNEESGYTIDSETDTSWAI